MTFLILFRSLLTNPVSRKPPTISRLSDLFQALGMNDLMYPDCDGYDYDLRLEQLDDTLRISRILNVDRRLPTEHTEGKVIQGERCEHSWKVHHRPLQVAGVDGQMYFIRTLYYAPTPGDKQVYGRIGDPKTGQEFRFTLRELCEQLGFQWSAA